MLTTMSLSLDYRETYLSAIAKVTKSDFPTYWNYCLQRFQGIDVVHVSDLPMNRRHPMKKTNKSSFTQLVKS